MKLPLALTLARRELRAGAKGFRILIACLALGVATIAAVQSLSQDILGGIESQGRTLLGGDLAIRTLYKPIEGKEREDLAALGRVSESIDLRGMARKPESDSATLVEVKAADTAYPLVGRVELAGEAATTPLPDVLARRDGVWGAAVEQAVLERLGAGSATGSRSARSRSKSAR